MTAPKICVIFLMPVGREVTLAIDVLFSRLVMRRRDEFERVHSPVEMLDEDSGEERVERAERVKGVMVESESARVEVAETMSVVVGSCQFIIPAQQLIFQKGPRTLYQAKGRTGTSMADAENRHGERYFARRVLRPEVTGERLKGTPDCGVVIPMSEVDSIIKRVESGGDVRQVPNAVVTACQPVEKRKLGRDSQGGERTTAPEVRGACSVVKRAESYVDEKWVDILHYDLS